MGYLLNLTKLATPGAGDTQKQSQDPSETGADTGFPCAPSRSETGPAIHSDTEAEIRRLLAREMRGAGADHLDYAIALAIALASPGAALEALRSPVESWSPAKRAELRGMAGELREGSP